MDDRAQQSTTDVNATSSFMVLGDYLVGPRLARCDAADVYDARHTHSGAPRLVYVLRPGAMQDQPLVHRVIFEVDAARWLRHAAVAKVDCYGDTPSRRLYVAVERPPGRTLGELLADEGALPPGRVVRLAARLVEALDEAHAVGLAHGRLTPAAVVVAAELDAGGAPLVSLTGLGTGSVAHDREVAAAERPYVSPERLAGGEPDERGDVFGLASLLYHALTGACPPEPGAPAAASAPDGAWTAAHAASAAALAAARALDPARRPATVKAFWEELLAALVADARPEAAAPPPAPAPVAAAPAPPDATLGALELDLLPSVLRADVDADAAAPVAAAVAAPVAVPVAAPIAAPVAVPVAALPVPWGPVPAPADAPPRRERRAPRASLPLPARRVARALPTATPVVAPVRRSWGSAWRLAGVAAAVVAAAAAWPVAWPHARGQAAGHATAAAALQADGPIWRGELPPNMYYGPPRSAAAARGVTNPFTDSVSTDPSGLPELPSIDVPVIDAPPIELQPRAPVVRADDFARPPRLPIAGI